MLSASRLINTYAPQKDTDDQPFKLTLDVIESLIVRARKNGDDITLLSMVFNTRSAADACFRIVRDHGYCVIDDDVTEMSTGMVHINFTVDWKAAILRQQSAIADSIYTNLLWADFKPEPNVAAGHLIGYAHTNQPDIVTVIKRIEYNDYTRIDSLMWMLHELNDDQVSAELILILTELVSHIDFDFDGQHNLYESVLALVESWGELNGYTLMRVLPYVKTDWPAWLKKYYESVYKSMMVVRQKWIDDATEIALKGIKNEQD